MATKKKYVPRRELLAAVMQGAKEGKTNAEVAKELGMAPDSFSSRVSTERSKLKDQGFHLPKLKTDGGRERLSDREAADFARSLMEELNSGSNESETEGESDDGELSMEDHSESEAKAVS